MNTPLMAWGGLQPMVDAPVWVVLVLKATAILSAAWLVHLAIARTNPRWRVFLWRVTAAGLFSLPAIAWLPPAVEIRVEQSASMKEARVVATTPQVPPGDRAASGHVPLGLRGDPSNAEAGRLPRNTVTEPFADWSRLPQAERLAPAPSEPSLVAMRVLPLAVWLGGLAILTFRLCIGYCRIWRLVDRAQRPPEWIRRECFHVARTIGCRGPVEVLESTGVQSPFLCGLGRPLVLLPARICDAAYREDLPGILAHELAHARSRDVPWNAGIQLISILLWFHPLVWRMRKAHLAACELACDAVSASFVGDVTEYCRTLARVAVDACGPLPTGGIAMARTSAVSRRLSALKARVFDLPLGRRRVMGFGFAALLAVVTLGTLQFALAASPSAETAAVAGQQAATPPANEAKSAKSADSKSEAGSLRVRVVDESGEPLGGTKLKVAFLGHKADYTSDAEGEAAVVVPAPNAKFLSIIAYPDGYPPMRKWWRNAAGNDLIPAEFTFAYERGRTIGGTVRDEQGKPIPGVKVHLSISSEKHQQVGMCLALWDRVFLTDAEGRWHLGHVPRIDSMAVGLEHPDYISVPGPVGISATEQRKIEDRTAVVVMKKGIPVSGTVTDPEGKPVANATVMLGEWYSAKRPSVSTDSKGYYRFASLAPGGAILTVTYPGLAPGLQSVKVQSRMKPVDFQLAKGNTLRVRVVGKDGKPISGIFVTPDTWRGKRVLCDLGIRGRTDAEGRWAWTWAPKDAVETNFGLTGRVNYMSIHHLPLVPQEAEHTVTLYQALAISGRVIDAETKQPIPSFRVVRGYMSRGSVEQLTWDRMQTREGKNGKYELTISQPSRTHLVRIEADGYQPAVSRELKNDDGTVTCDFSLDKGQNLNVAVRLPDGNPAAGADVRLCPEEPGKFINMALFVKNGRFPYRDPTRPSMKVGADGQLRIEPQDKEFLLIVLNDQGCAQTTSQELSVNPQIVLKAWARLEGVVLDGTKPVPGAKLDVYPTESSGPRWSFLNFHEQAEADAEGKFVFAKLKPGKWRVRELPAESGRPVGPQQHQKAVELGPGQTLDVTLGGAGRRGAGRR